MNLLELWRKPWGAGVIGFIVGKSAGFLFTFLVLDVPLPKSVGAGLLFAILCSTLGYQLRFIPEIRTKIEETFEKRMNQIIEFVALGTQNRYFETHLGKMREENLGNLRWVVAKFISYKLNKDFSHLSQMEIPNVSATDYSKLLGDLIKECSESIYFTCPSTPTEWFVKLRFNPCMNHSPCKDSPHNPDPSCPYQFLMKRHLPEHIRSFCDSKVKDRKRIINLPKGKLGSLKRDNQCFRNFLNYYEDEDKVEKRISRNIETDDKINVRFVAQEDLDPSIEKEYKEGDYNILDSKIVMKWDEESGKCKLIFDRGEIEKHLKIFENIDASPYKKVEDIPESSG